MSITPLTFTGVSTFSSDLQTVLNRAVSIAKLPLTALQNQDSDVLQRKTLLGGLNTPLASLGSAVKQLGQLAANKSLTASSSDSSKVAVTYTSATAPAQYSITSITSLATSASETSTSHYADSATTPVSSTGKLELDIGSQKLPITLDSNNLLNLRDKINGLGAGVSASILTTSNGNYLSVTADATGSTTLKLVDDPTGAATNLLTTANQGTNAVFKFNNIDISRSSNTVNDLVTGMTFTIEGTTTGAETVNLTLASDRSQLSNAIQDFATKYNAVVDQVGRQVGSNAGLLSGDFLIREVQQDLRSLGNYQASGTVQSLSDMGVNFDASGKISFDTAKFTALSDSQMIGAFQFFGSSSTGFGALSAKFDQLTDPISGLIKVQQDGYDTADHRLQDRITTLTDQINTMQASVASRLQVADSLLASLQSQQNQITSSVQSLNYVLYGKQTTSQ